MIKDEQEGRYSEEEERRRKKKKKEEEERRRRRRKTNKPLESKGETTPKTKEDLTSVLNDNGGGPALSDCLGNNLGGDGLGGALLEGEDHLLNKVIVEAIGGHGANEVQVAIVIEGGEGAIAENHGIAGGDGLECSGPESSPVGEEGGGGVGRGDQDEAEVSDEPGLETVRGGSGGGEDGHHVVLVGEVVNGDGVDGDGRNKENKGNGLEHLIPKKMRMKRKNNGQLGFFLRGWGLSTDKELGVLGGWWVY